MLLENKNVFSYNLGVQSKDGHTPSDLSKSNLTELKTKSDSSVDKDDKGGHKMDVSHGGPPQGMSTQEYYQLQHQKWVQQQMMQLQVRLMDHSCDGQNLFHANNINYNYSEASLIRTHVWEPIIIRYIESDS